MNSAVAPTLRRRNGRLQACDPCRSRKVACDHSQPVCNRCRKRKQGKHCVYTVDSSSDRPISPPSAPLCETPATLNSGVNTVHSESPGSQGTASRIPGYLGYVSYTSVYEEARGGLSISRTGPDTDSSSRRTDADSEPISQKILQKCLTVLRHIPSKDDPSLLSFRDSEIYYDWFNRMTQEILRSLYEPGGFGERLGKERNDNSLEPIAREICFNTAQPLSEVGSNYKEWINQFTGLNIRWESLGLLFYFSFLSSSPQSASRADRAQEKARWQLYRDYISTCIELCEAFSDGSFVLVYLHHRRTVLESRSSGDASRQTLKFHAETVASMTFLGLHAEPSLSSYRPSLHSEFKRRMFTAVYYTDKVYANPVAAIITKLPTLLQHSLLLAVTGRPPLITRRFVTTPLPLDLADDYLSGDQETLLARVSDSLDENGWNIEGHVHHATWMRASMMLVDIKEAVIEIACWTRLQESIELLLELRTKQTAVVAAFPRSLIYSPEDLEDLNLDYRRIHTRMMVRMEILQNEFLLARLLSRKGHKVDGDILVTSFELVTLCVNLWTHFDRFGKMQRDFEWILISYGAPAGGILCKELLKPTFRGNHPQDHKLTRSSIIQKLSLLVAFLDWINPSAPNANLCKDCKSVIQLVLDQHLEATSEGLSAPATADYDFSTPLDFNFELLDSFDWLVSETRDI